MTNTFKCTITIECAMEGYKLFRPLIMSPVIRMLSIFIMLGVSIMFTIGAFVDNYNIIPAIIVSLLTLLIWKIADTMIWISRRKSRYTNQIAELGAEEDGVRVAVAGLCDQTFMWDAYDAASIDLKGIVLKHKNKNMCQYFRFRDMTPDVRDGFVNLVEKNISKVRKCV